LDEQKSSGDDLDIDFKSGDSKYRHPNLDNSTIFYVLDTSGYNPEN